jgi:hypothetical protein
MFGALLMVRVELCGDAFDRVGDALEADLLFNFFFPI